MPGSKYNKPQTSRISDKTIASLLKTISFTCVYSKQNVEADAYSKEEQQVAKGIMMIKECMDEIIYVSESII